MNKLQPKYPLRAVQIINRKEHTVPHYQWIVLGADNWTVCVLPECMQQDQPSNEFQAKRIAAALNATADIAMATLESAPCGHASEWFEAWLAALDRSSVPQD